MSKKTKSQKPGTPPSLEDPKTLAHALRSLLYERCKVYLKGEAFDALACQAMTSKAWADAERARTGKRPLDNERLEFLGDKVWTFYVARIILAEFGEEKRGILRILQGYLWQLVSGKLQERLAYQLGLDKLLLLPSSYTSVDRGNKLETKKVLVGSALEALVAAVFLQSQDAAEKMILKLITPELPKLEREGRSFTNDDPRLVVPHTQVEWIGYHTLSLVGVYRGYKSNSTLSEIHADRNVPLTIEYLVLIADIMRMREAADTDERAARRFLEFTGTAQVVEGPFLMDKITEPATEAETKELLNACGVTLTFVREVEATPVSAKQAVKTLLNGKSKNLVVREYKRGAEGTQIVVTYKGVEVGTGTHTDPAQAEEKAYHQALHHPDIIRARDGLYEH